MTSNISLDNARQFAKKYSIQYGTVWYVRQTGALSYTPCAHDSGTVSTVAAYDCGKMQQTAKQEEEAAKLNAM